MKISTGSHSNSLIAFFILASAVVALDQLTKYLVSTYVELGTGLVVIPGFFDLVHTRNPGAAFGIMSQSAISYRWLFFVVVSVIALCIILWIMFSSRNVDRYLTAAYALFFGGALGNLIDRIRFGEVVDFLDVHWGVVHWPAFNVADSALCAAAGFFLLHLLTEKKDR